MAFIGGGMSHALIKVVLGVRSKNIKNKLLRDGPNT